MTDDALMGPEGLSYEPSPAYLNGLVATVVVHVCVRTQPAYARRLYEYILFLFLTFLSLYSRQIVKDTVYSFTTITT